MREQLQLIGRALACGDGADAEHRWEDIEDALWQITEGPPTPEVEKALVSVLCFKGRLRLAPSSEFPHSMSPEEMLKSLAIQALGKWTGVAHLPEMQHVAVTASSPVLAGVARAVIREATLAQGRASAPMDSCSTYNLPGDLFEELAERVCANGFLQHV